MIAETRRILLEAVVIVLLGVVLGLSFNGRLLLNVFSGRLPQTQVETEPRALYPVPVDLAAVRELTAAGAVLIDARAAELYADGHLPGARSLPLGEMDEHLEAFRRAVPTDAVIITYCNGYGCPDSFDQGVRLLAAGWRDVRVFEGGYPEWRDAGLPVEQGAP
ncbi:MAG TPA: rhodanese-like domain-containing protein [Desulfuromonadales bacterium]|nr:rhodanese-like domain-containing protein [Desulfuromonadales bacterium]